MEVGHQAFNGAKADCRELLAENPFQSDVLTMNRRGYIAYGAGIASVALFTARYTFNATADLYQFAGGITALGATAWLASTFGPITLSVFVWMIAQRTQARWLPHLLFIPAAIAVFRVGASSYVHEVGISGESMAADFALLMGLGYLALSLSVHVIALAMSGVLGIGRHASGS